MTPSAIQPLREPSPDPARALEDATRAARAASHSRRLDTAVQAALAGQGDCNAALVTCICWLAARLSALEAKEATRVRSDP